MKENSSERNHRSLFQPIVTKHLISVVQIVSHTVIFPRFQVLFSDSLGKVKLAIITILVAMILVGASSYLYIYKWSSPMVPERQVGETAVVTGRVESIEREAYCIKIILKILSEERGSPRFQVGNAIGITFSGIGEVPKWRAYSLREDDVIRCEIRWVEGSYWEAFDDGWSYA